MILDLEPLEHVHDQMGYALRECEDFADRYDNIERDALAEFPGELRDEHATLSDLYNALDDFRRWAGKAANRADRLMGDVAEEMESVEEGDFDDEY